MSERLGTMFAYRIGEELVSAMLKFKEPRLADAIARSMTSRLGHPVEIWYRGKGERSDLYTAKWFDGDVFKEAVVTVLDIRP